MLRSGLLASVSLVCLLTSGCITINTFGRGEEPLVETGREM